MPDNFISYSYNPDVLSCLANLSNDEVFTPPEIVKQMLDLLPEELWQDSKATFLDPCCKSGVFLREIAKRLLKGLETEIPILQERIDHIFQRQLYGIAITELTSLLSRRSLYCSKYPNSKYSVTEFAEANIAGNIRYKKIQHTWNDNRCTYCGAAQAEYDRHEDLETHAYEFIHTENPEEIFNMKFDVIIGNPPYQLNDGGGTGSSAIPIYQNFILQAKKLNPKYLSMIIPARWYTGGRGLDAFRDDMLNDARIAELHDFEDAGICFPSVEIKGGICYFLWSRDYQGNCLICNHSGGMVDCITRPMRTLDLEYFVRNNGIVSILEKVRSNTSRYFSDLVSANDPYGFDVREKGSYRRVRPNFSLTKQPQDILFYYNGWRNEGSGYINPDSVTKNSDLIDSIKIFIPKAWGTGIVGQDKLNPIIENRPSCCTETYLHVGPFDSIDEARNAASYIETKFFHFLVGIVKITQNAMKKVYSNVPLVSFFETWSDEKLFELYDLSPREQEFILSAFNDDARLTNGN